MTKLKILHIPTGLYIKARFGFSVPNINYINSNNARAIDFDLDTVGFVFHTSIDFLEAEERFITLICNSQNRILISPEELLGILITEIKNENV